MNILTFVLSIAVLINNDWSFSLGSAKGMQEDFTHGTEYFTYITKARANNQSISPIMPAFDDSAWQKVNLPHDWVVDLPFSGEASHSHGYKCIGWKYPENSVGWYRKNLQIPSDWEGRRVWVVFDGIFRDSQVFINGYYVGGRNDGYLQQVYDLTDYIDFGADNLLTVRCDASLEEGWFYEGAGIYRNVWLHSAEGPAVLPLGVRTIQEYNDGTYSLDVELSLAEALPEGIKISSELLDREGKVVASACAATCPERSEAGILKHSARGRLSLSGAREWSLDAPYLYTLRTIVPGPHPDTTYTSIGLRRAEFSANEGFLLNGKKVLLKGCNLHQDHAGVGSGIPDELWRYRLEQLRSYGFNAIRCSHNPASPALLDLCDELGFAIIDENREFGSASRQLNNLGDMIDRDINHPCVILWSVGNEEWALEWSTRGTRIAERLCEYAHRKDPSRLCTYGSSGGRELVKGVDVLGYNYIVQNPVEEYHVSIPYKTAVGTEETSGAGTRGEYVTDPENGWMQPLNRRDTLGVVNAIERGWKFYHQNTWTCGLFYWTGIDYRGEANPMVWPATGSQFGILDYCAFPKDEAFYLRSWWQPEQSTIHICGLSNGEVWVYSNCSEVELFKGRKSLGRQRMPVDGHIAWKVGDVPEGTVFTAKGVWKSPAGKAYTVKDVWPSMPEETSWALSKDRLLPDGQDVVVIDIDSPESSLAASAVGCQILGWGNGDPGFKELERPINGSTSIEVKPFNGKCQLLVRSIEGSSSATVNIGGRSIAL